MNKLFIFLSDQGGEELKEKFFLIIASVSLGIIINIISVAIITFILKW